MSTMLEEDGHTVETAYDGERGLELGMENPYHVMILDVMLPPDGRRPGCVAPCAQTR